MPIIHRKKKEVKKFVKVMKRFGMVEVEGITRITMRTNRNFVMYIDNPIVMTSGTSGNNYVIFGEPQYLDHAKKATEEKAEKFTGE